MLLDKATTDWLCTKPVFYNEKTGAISHNMEEVVDYSDFRINAEGLRNFLRFGYTVFGQTIVEGVKCLDHSSQIEKAADGSLKITHFDDAARKLWNPGQTNSTEVFESIIDASAKWADAVPEEEVIVLPLSGGYDSRLLAYSLRGRENVHTYSYGLSANQRDSFEVVKASQVAKACDLKWEHIYLDKFLDESYLSRWYELYGGANHLHGMYQMEFYDNIISHEGGNVNGPKLNLLSGIIGDVWAGTVRTPDISSTEEFIKLGYTHGICIDEDICLYDNELVGKLSKDAAQRFYEENKDMLSNESWRVVCAMRMKMLLLHYLLKTPDSLGITPFSPFIDPKIAMSILNLDWSLKDNRKWQQKEFDKINLEIGWEKKKCDYNMVIDIETLRKNPVRPLDVEALGRVVRREYVEEVNRQISRRPLKTLPAKPKTVQNVYNKAVKKYNSKIDKALISYEILGSVERMIRRAKL